MENFSDRLSRLMKSKKISQTKLSEELNIRQTTISAWCLGKTMPDISTQIKLANFLDVKPEYLTYGVDVDKAIREATDPAQVSKDELLEFYKWKASNK
jgi:transcriptional regulator with XRE-family HTH domain